LLLMMGKKGGPKKGAKGLGRGGKKRAGPERGTGHGLVVHAGGGKVAQTGGKEPKLC